MFRYAYKPTGFTLIELIISIGIFVILTAMVISNFTSGKYHDELVDGTGVLQAAIREAQAFTNAGSTILCPSTATPVVPVGGFGVYLDQPLGQPATAIVFADCESTHSPFYYDPAANPQYDAVVHAVALPANDMIEAASSPTLPISIVFSSFEETVKVATGSTSTAGPAIIKLAHQRSKYTQSITVNQVTGQVFAAPPQPGT